MIKRGVTAYIAAAFKNKKLIITILTILKCKYKDFVVLAREKSI
jgi:hypothetical protein